MSPIVLKDEKGATKIAFVTYYKGEYGIHTLNRDKPLNTVASADFGAPGPIIDFQPPMTHTLVKQNARKKGTFEKLFLEGRPPVNVGVTSGGDLFGGTQVTFTDVLGDKQFNMFAASVSQYRTMSFSYVNLSRRLQYALQAYSQTQFYYGYNPGLLFATEYGYIDRDLAQATQTARGATAYGIYPLNRYARLELSAGSLQFSQEYNEPGLQELADEYQEQQYGRTLFNSGTFMPFGITYVQETTVFREYGPLAGNTVRVGYEYAPSAGSLLSRQTADVDARYYMRLGTNGVLALRARGFKSWGEFPATCISAATRRCAATTTCEFLGNKAFFAQRRAALPADRSGADADRRGRRPARRHVLQLRRRRLRRPADEGLDHRTRSSFTPLLGYEPDPFSITGVQPVFGPPDRPSTASGWSTAGRRTASASRRSRSDSPSTSTGRGERSSTRTRRTCVFAYQAALDGEASGSNWFRQAKFSLWIGYDF